MSDHQQIYVQRVELLSVAPGQSMSGEPTVILTIRPDQGSFRPHNIALSRPQAIRLLESLRTVLRQSAGILLLGLPLVGCSAQVEVISEKAAPRADSNAPPPAIQERTRTAVAVRLLDVNGPSPVGEAADKPVSRPERAVQVTGNANLVIVAEGDLSEPDHDRPKAAGKRPCNTKIGWPTQLRGKGTWALGCYLAECALLVAVLALMLDGLKRERGGPLLSVLAMLGTAAVLLQFLPHTESGIQFLPISPWSYSGWLSVGISLVCWTAILAAGYVALSGCLDAPRVFAAVCVFAMVLNALLSFSELKEGSTAPKQAAASLETTFYSTGG